MEGAPTLLLVHQGGGVAGAFGVLSCTGSGGEPGSSW